MLRPKQQYRTGPVSLLLIIVGFLNLLVFVAAYGAARGAPDFQGLPAELVAIACLIISGFLWMAGLMCVGYSLRANQHTVRSTIGMIAGGSALIAWPLIHAFGR